MVQSQASDNITPLTHCEALFSEIKDKLDGDRPESYHRALLMEAAEALKGADDLTSVYYGYRVW